MTLLVAGCQLGGNSIDLGLSLLDGNTRLETSHDGVASNPAQDLCARQAERQEEFHALAEESEIWGHDADHGCFRPIQRQRLPDDLRIARKAALPHSMADDHYRSDVVDLILVVGEGPAHPRRHAEQPEQ